MGRGLAEQLARAVTPGLLEESRGEPPLAESGVIAVSDSKGAILGSPEVIPDKED